MLLTTALSEAKKTKGAAVTYRAGQGNVYGTCPISCSLNPEPALGTERVDHAYLRSLLRAVPPRGVGFTYTHFSPRQWAPEFLQRLETGKPTTTVNYSCETRQEATSALRAGVPVVLALPLGETPRVQRLGGLRVVRCPAEYNPRVTCVNCGGCQGPLCARPSRDYAIGFTAHGHARHKVGADCPGGCYAAGGNVRLQWNRLANRSQAESDGAILSHFARHLSYGTVLRHHVAGDIGAVPC